MCARQFGLSSVNGFVQLPPKPQSVFLASRGSAVRACQYFLQSLKDKFIFLSHPTFSCLSWQSLSTVTQHYAMRGGLHAATYAFAAFDRETSPRLIAMMTHYCSFCGSRMCSKRLQTPGGVWHALCYEVGAVPRAGHLRGWPPQRPRDSTTTIGFGCVFVYLPPKSGSLSTRGGASCSSGLHCVAGGNMCLSFSCSVPNDCSLNALSHTQQAPDVYLQFAGVVI